MEQISSCESVACLPTRNSLPVVEPEDSLPYS
jgi:hypothetical protein